jgi:predicted MPP superfamily phosphohydrolase
MRTLAHVSDLHFGRVAPGVLEPLRRRLAALAPDVLVVSGDLTQRARGKQFREARAFLDSLPRPQVVVPGNHDVPLFNVFGRFLRPLRAYRRVIADDVEPGYVDEELVVLGVNTARSLTFKSGRVSARQIERLRDALCGLDAGVARVVVTHHPIPALESRIGYPLDVLLSGHGHATRVSAGLPTLVVEAGTATSSRTREEPNGFNVLRITQQWVEVEHFALRTGSFERVRRARYARREGRWASDEA